MEPSYLQLYRKGKLEEIKNRLTQSLENCNICPRNCGVNRLKGEVGFCKTTHLAKVDSFFLHFGEEPELVGRGGSGTIFFSWCNLGCIYCQNYPISHLGEGREVSKEELAEMMITLQDNGAENINFVTPTHVVAQIVEALSLAIQKGLSLPLVYNCGGYESVETLKVIEGVFDIYMPDVKYSDDSVASKLSSAPNYWEVVKEVLKEMHRQVGYLVIIGGIAKKGLLIRHLVLPSRLAGSFKILDFIKEEISVDTYINIMEQYRPCFNAHYIKELSRRPTIEEFKEVLDYARKLGFYRGF
ncbi:MAG: radical SAM protein [Candidatus Omnitrophota bacterium]|nr:MAG: radical SAM protein [Candidatus Omnitrophota bacterium]